MTSTVAMKCAVCHKEYLVNVNDTKMYESPIVMDNGLCPSCRVKTQRVKLVLTCSKCGHVFQTSVLAVNRDKYNDKWECPMCISNSLPQVKTAVEKKNSIELNCDGCRLERGVCFHPELNCSLAKHFAQFSSGDIYSVKKECTVLSVHKIIKDRDDIHCFEYTLLYKSNYGLAPTNVVIVKQRRGSKKQFTTNIIVYVYDKSKHQFNTAIDKTYKKGEDWIVPTRDFLLSR